MSYVAQFVADFRSSAVPNSPAIRGESMWFVVHVSLPVVISFLRKVQCALGRDVYPVEWI